MRVIILVHVCDTHLLDLSHIPTKSQTISSGTAFMKCIKFHIKPNITRKGNLKTKAVGVTFLYVTCLLDLSYIPTKLSQRVLELQSHRISYPNITRCYLKTKAVTVTILVCNASSWPVLQTRTYQISSNYGEKCNWQTNLQILFR